ncbi:hypothetical protein [Kangiella sp.]|uniref:hypothetical protein n=1 Tax=Kangiella sp. TaxID=1920245 RepID=UPI003A8EC72B
MSGDVTKIKTLPAFLHYNAKNLGYTSTPIEFIVEGLTKDISVDQLGDEIIAKINQGSNVSLKATFKEVDKAFLLEMYGSAGIASEFTGGSCSDPQYKDEASCTLATETWTPADETVIGFGSKNVGTNLAANAKPIKVIPTNEAEVANSLYFWLAYPIPGSLKYSGAEENEMEVEFRIIEDKTKPSAVSKGFLGDPAKMPNLVA